MDDGSIEYLQELQNIDEELCKHVQMITNYILTERNAWARNNREAIQNNIHIVGSFSENCALARVFQINPSFSDQLNRETELDLEYMICEIPENMKDKIILEIPEKRGFVKLRVDLDVLENVRRLGWSIDNIDLVDVFNKATTKDGLMQPNKFKQAFLEKTKFSDNHHRVEVLLAAILGKSKNNISVTDMTETVTTATTALKFLINVHENPFLKVSLDSVALFRLPWWPSVGNEWKQRKRRWPSQEKIDEISRIGFIIAKPSDTTDMDTTELRYSFGHVERELVRMRSRYQNLVYLIFKAMFYKWIKPINNEKISSYIAKTIMLWTCEELPSHDTMWSKNFASLIDALSHLFAKLLYAFDVGHLEYFFNSEINIMDGISQENKEEAYRMVYKILANLKSYIPIPMDEEMRVARELMKCMKTAVEIFDEIKNKNYSRLFQQPELFEDVLLFIDLI